MKRILNFIVVLFILAAPSLSLGWGNSVFCRGWEAGYKHGYCYKEFACIDPITPICPIPDVGEDGYRDGYNRGFLAGLGDKQK